MEKPRNGWLDAVLARRSGTNPDAVQIAAATVAVWYGIAAALQSIIGKQGFAALYNRSAALTARQHDWLATSRAGDDHATAFDELQSLIARQSNENAALGSSELLQTFYGVLASLIGPALCEQLLASVREHCAFGLNDFMKSKVLKEVIDPVCLAKPEAGSSILLVDDDSSAIQLISAILADVGKLRFATNGHDALRLARESEPDLILLDAEMPGMSGFELLKALKAESALAAVPVIFITSHSEAGFEVSALDMGAADFIAKPLRSSRVLARVRTQLRMKLMADELRRTATTDALTGVANRRHFDESIEREWLRARQGGDPVSLLMIDVDHFKLYNDLYGHPKGDVCLQCVAQALLSASTGPADLVARYGGEEFAVLLPRMSRQGAQEVARKSIEAVAARGILHQDTGTTHHVTVSAGIACYDDVSPCWDTPCGVDDLVLAADKALYAAKHSGRAQAQLREISPHAITVSDKSTPRNLVNSLAATGLWK